MQSKTGLEVLTTRERQVFALLKKGLLNKQCAGELACSIRTIEAHRASIFRKLKVRNLTELLLIFNDD